MPGVLIVNISRSLQNALKLGGWGVTLPIGDVIEECTRGVWCNLQNPAQFEYVIAIASDRSGGERTVRGCFAVREGSWSCLPNPVNFPHRIVCRNNDVFFDCNAAPANPRTWRNRWEFAIDKVLEVVGNPNPVRPLPWGNPLLGKTSAIPALNQNGCYYTDTQRVARLFR